MTGLVMGRRRAVVGTLQLDIGFWVVHGLVMVGKARLYGYIGLLDRIMTWRGVWTCGWSCDLWETWAGCHTGRACHMIVL